jgi:hypothetical protein
VPEILSRSSCFAAGHHFCMDNRGSKICSRKQSSPASPPLTRGSIGLIYSSNIMYSCRHSMMCVNLSVTRYKDAEDGRGSRRTRLRRCFLKPSMLRGRVASTSTVENSHSPVVLQTALAPMTSADCDDQKRAEINYKKRLVSYLAVSGSPRSCRPP